MMTYSKLQLMNVLSLHSIFLQFHFISVSIQMHFRRPLWSTVKSACVSFPQPPAVIYSAAHTLFVLSIWQQLLGIWRGET